MCSETWTDEYRERPVWFRYFCFTFSRRRSKKKNVPKNKIKEMKKLWTHIKTNDKYFSFSSPWFFCYHWLDKFHRVHAHALTLKATQPTAVPQKWSKNHVLLCQCFLIFFLFAALNLAVARLLLFAENEHDGEEENVSRKENRNYRNCVCRSRTRSPRSKRMADHFNVWHRTREQPCTSTITRFGWA